MKSVVEEIEYMEKALVTGGAGFIGSNIAEELVAQGVEVVVLDNLYLGEESNLEDIREDIEFIKGSVTDRETVREAVEGCDTVFHQAARSSAPMHKENPGIGARVNVEGFVNTVRAAEEAGAEKVVFASTSSMYGSVNPPHSEDMGEIPVNLYSASKMSREMYSHSFSEVFDIQTTGLRYFSVYGPHEKSKGEYANIITQFLWKMQRGEKPVIFGDGTQSRDFTYVKDVVRANIMAAERRKELDGEYFNIGTGKSVTFNEIVDKLNEKLGTDIEPEYVENPIENYVQSTRADIDKSKKVLGYEPKYDLAEGLDRIIDFYS